MSRSRPIPILAVLAVLAIVLAACSSNGGGGESAAAEESTAATDDSGGGGGGDGDGGAETVTITGSSFGDDLTVAAGTTVTFQNDDGFEHSVTEGVDGTPADDAAFDEDVEGGESVDITFDEPGEYQITCRYHPTMNFTVTVEG